MTKEKAIEKINNTPSIYLNDDQKKIAIQIIKQVPNEQEVQGYYDFIIKRSNVGFKFDVAPEIADGRLAIVNEMPNLNINISPGGGNKLKEHKLIIGDNYESLKNLLLTHKEKIDIIYIDPPYNTESTRTDGNNSSKEGTYSKFIYKDKFGRNGWLNLLRERLILAKKLLTNDGMIFVSIDDSEYAYLKVLMDDIFGEQNFLATMPRLLKKGGGGNTDKISINLDYVLIYYNDFFSSINQKDTNSVDYNQKDKHFEKRGYYHVKTPLDVNSLPYRKQGDFKVVMEGKNFYPGSKELYKKRQQGVFSKQDWIWRWNKRKIDFAIKNDFLKIKEGGSREKVIYRKIYLNCEIQEKNKQYFIKYKKRKQAYESFELCTNEFISNEFFTRRGKEEIESILGKNQEFYYPKPTSLIKFLINLVNKKDAIVLDFFAGSGTTGHAVMDLNQEDKGGRQFILCTNNENEIALNVTHKRLLNIMTKCNNDWQNKKKNNPFINDQLRVFNIKHFDVGTDQSEELNNITKFASNNLKKLDPNYLKGNIRIYYDLSGLSPLNEAQKNQIYSTDKIIHKQSSKIKNNYKYCTCNKKFENDILLNKHFDEENR